MKQVLLTKALRAKLLENYKTPDANHKPVVKFFTPWGAATWLITDMDDTGRMFGLCDLGQGYPELGYVSLEELQSLRGPVGLRVERDVHFGTSLGLEEIAELSRDAGEIVTERPGPQDLFSQASANLEDIL